MDSCKKFARKYPLVIVALTTLLVFALLEITELFPRGPYYLAIREIIMTAVVFVWTFIFMGKEKVSFSPKGFGYAFRSLRGYFIFLGIYCGLAVFSSIVSGDIPSDLFVRLVNAFVIGATVGIMEEFSFRGLVFGGILYKIGKSKKNYIVAAVVSGLIFGAMHVLISIFSGEVNNFTSVVASLLKTLQSGIFGVLIALIYIKTKNILAIAALHGLDDLILLIMSSFSNSDGIKSSYVSGDIRIFVAGYVFLTIVVIPMLIKVIKDLGEDESAPFEDDFLPMAVKYEKKKAKKK